jgi:hypothetical protein
MRKREEASIEISKWLVDSFQVHEADHGMLLSNELEQHLEVIENLLLGYHYAEAGKVSHVKVEQDSIIFNKRTSGSFIAEYKTYFAMACSDKGYSNDNKMSVEFQIDLQNKKMRLLGEELQERLPDDF